MTAAEDCDRSHNLAFWIQPTPQRRLHITAFQGATRWQAELTAADGHCTTSE
jgi:hypothetical protein